MRVGDDARRDADHHLAGRGDPVELVEVVEVVDDDPGADLGRRAQLGLGLRVAVEDDPVALEARRCASASSPPEATSTLSPSSLEDAQDRRARERLGREDDLAVAHRGRNSRARPRRSSSATAYSGVPNSRASSRASQPPIDRRPSTTSEASGYRHWRQAC